MYNNNNRLRRHKLLPRIQNRKKTGHKLRVQHGEQSDLGTNKYKDKQEIQTIVNRRYAYIQAVSST